MRTRLPDLIETLDEWVFTPIAKQVLTPMHNAISGLFNSLKTAFGNFGRTLNEWIF